MIGWPMDSSSDESSSESSGPENGEGAASATSANEDDVRRTPRCRKFLTRCCALFPARTSSDAHDADAAFEEERARSFDALQHDFMHGDDSQLFDLRTHPFLHSIAFHCFTYPI